MRPERSERRMDCMMAGRLAAMGNHAMCEWVAIRNISIHGAQVVSERPWCEGGQVNLGETVGQQQLDAEVMYCERLRDGRYALGLKFIAVERLDTGLYSPQYRSQEAWCDANAG